VEEGGGGNLTLREKKVQGKGDFKRERFQRVLEGPMPEGH